MFANGSRALRNEKNSFEENISSFQDGGFTFEGEVDEKKDDDVDEDLSQFGLEEDGINSIKEIQKSPPVKIENFQDEFEDIFPMIDSIPINIAINY